MIKILSSNNLQGAYSDLPQSHISEQNQTNNKIPGNPCKTGHSGQNKEKQNYDKSTFHLPRQYLPLTDV